MSEHELSILLRLRDEASKQIEQFGQKVKDSMEEASQSMVELGRQISKVGKDMTFLGAAITGPLALAFKTSAQYSLESHESLKRLNDSAISFQITIGEALAPVIEKVSYIIAGLTKWFQELDPKIRDTALQTIFISGIFITLAGALTTVIGRVILFSGHLLALAAANLPLLAIVASLVAIIIAWEKIKSVVMPILNVLEYGIDTVALAIQGLNLLVSETFYGIAESAERLFHFLAQAPGPQQGLFKSLEMGARGIADYFDQASRDSTESITLIQEEMDNLITSLFTGEGALSSSTDDIIEKIRALWDILQNPPKTDINGDFLDAQKVIVNEQQKVDQLRSIWAAWNDEKLSMEMARLQSETEFYQLAIDAQTKAHQSMWTVIGQAKDTFTSGVSKLFVDMMKGVADVKKFFQDLGWKMVEILVNYATQVAVNWTVAQTLLAAQIATSTGAAALIAAAWAPAAAMVSLATMGGNAGPASAALATTTVLAQVLAIPKLEKGGDIYSAGRVLVGERGPEILNLPRGARVSPLGNAGNNIEINIEINNPNISNQMDLDDLTREISSRIAREADRIT